MGVSINEKQSKIAGINKFNKHFFLEQLSIEKIKLSTPYTETQDGWLQRLSPYMLICSDIQTKDVAHVIVRLYGIYTTSEATRKYICQHHFFFSQDYQTDSDNITSL